MVMEYDSAEILEIIFKYFACAWFIHGCCAFLSYSVGVPAYSQSRSDKIVWNYTCASALYCALISYCYLRGCLDFYHTVEGRWTGSSTLTVHGISFHLGASIYECVCYAMSGKESVFYYHHLVTVLCCGSMLFMGRAHFWCCMLGLVEFSNVPLSLLTILGATPALKASPLYTLNGLMLWLSYALLRLPIPWAMYYLAVDLLTYDVAFVFSDPIHHKIWVSGIFASAGFLWLLSMFWFSKITKGIMKALGIGTNGGLGIKKTA